jgi:hypothetical protein
MAATVKPGVFTVVKTTKWFCRFITKHRGTFQALIDAAISDPADRAVVHAMYDGVIAACAILEIAYPDIHP